MDMKPVRRALAVGKGALADGNGRIRERLIVSLHEISRNTDLSILICDEDAPEAVLSLLEGEGIVLEREEDLSLFDSASSYEVGDAGTPFRPLSLPWQSVASYLVPAGLESRKAHIERKTNETDISIDLDLDGTGKGRIVSGIGFFDHMMDQLVRHSRCDIDGFVKGDLDVDMHHTIEDAAISLGEAFSKALGAKRGIERYGFEMVTMDDTAATVALDFSGRPYLIWDVEFTLPMIGNVPTELFRHFFQSFAASAKCNLYISALRGGDSHHTAEAVFKAFARAIRKAVRRIPGETGISSTKGVL